MGVDLLIAIELGRLVAIGKSRLVRHDGLVRLVAYGGIQRLQHLLMVVESLADLAPRHLDLLQLLQIVLKCAQRLIVHLLLLHGLESVGFPAESLEFMLLNRVELLAIVLV